MLEQVKSQFEKQNIDPASKKILVAVSGGMDSMALLHLLKSFCHRLHAAHVNYNLRGIVSTEDAKLVEDFCRSNSIKFHGHDVLDVAKLKDSGNLQSKARNIRYGFFNDVMDQHDIDFLLTAHHLNDQLENILLNIFRGIGPKLIPSLHRKVFRPLLSVSKEDLKKFVENNKIPYREDKSNQVNKYDRNFLRNEIIPQLITRFPNIEGKLVSFAERYWHDQSIIDKLFDKNPENEIDLTKLRSSREIFHAIKSLNFSYEQAQEIFKNKDNLKFNIASRSHVLNIGQDIMRIYPLATTVKQKSIIIALKDLPFSEQWASSFQVDLCNPITDDSGHLEENEFLLNKATLTFPLQLRSWEPGDRIVLKGMDGKSKKLKKLFNDHKINKFEKNSYPILVNSDNQIIAVIGLRCSSQFNEANTSNECLLLKWSKI